MIQSSSATITKKTARNESATVDPIAELKKEDSNELRPGLLADFIGQSRLKKQLSLVIESARKRNALPDHILFYGNPGLGKTTLASLVSTELGCEFKIVSAPALQRAGDIVSLLLNVENNTVIFIDEIHRLRTSLEETLYTAMEDKKVDLVMGKGHGVSATRLDIPNVTIIGATTLLGKLSKPLKDRFPNIFQIQPYSDKEMQALIERNCQLLQISLDQKAVISLSSRCRGIPRIANNLLKRLRDYQVVHSVKQINQKEMHEFLKEIGIMEQGITVTDLDYLESLQDGAKGIKTISARLLEEVETIELVTEPYLIHLGLVNKTSNGREITLKGRELLEKFRKTNGMTSLDKILF